jgi:eukaryotic-like serine/threonine-protein kinase
MGVVFGAEDLSLRRLVAIKFLMPQKADREGAVARFLREAKAAASIQSEHVARVFEVNSLPNGASYIVMERLVGTDFAHVLLQRGALSITEAVDHLLQVCEALSEAHAREAAKLVSNA